MHDKKNDKHKKNIIDINQLKSMSLESLRKNLSEGTKETEYEFKELEQCITTVENALRGTNWEKAMDEATRLCFSCLWIAFIMARHAHPTFPAMADWSVMARMKMPLLSGQCLFESKTRKSWEPRWDASCFHDGQLVLGEGMDESQLYVKTDGGRWTRVDLVVSTEIKKVMDETLKKEQAAFSSSQNIDNSIWALVGR